ncbi:aldehyde oxidase [Pseudomonas viridiflava]|uniref:Putative aldehyde and xanthine dehydrogenase, molybdenum binding subunit n=2 Tax=Pseudomonas syringae group TaxID=136849 RepID=A0A0P9YDX0_PSESI|nr:MULTISPECIES: xanthine dehydrogenase family protein molybdopterin-binding subunit [Pseudomonas syringae group]EKN45643.1 aldehyde oxidase and xanthine dehydrogenase family protein [Pseudomonas viridiflava UASWS0038]KPL61678.1 aldehyde oxidase [Pseudomonas viridiflava]KPY43985.1 putative aldehyde and xanthine dehydrogenase, molybdenum binding subunit [Pseudomonas syringae pv. ribicola]MEE4223436.1 xanthine dehydrogenase family protein molybdopterin-binding subunit [Pseudomonas viridiflava]OA
MNVPFSPMGKPVDRVDGKLKVTGGARYAGEYPEDGLLFGSVVSSTIANGRVLNIDTSDALKVPGVVAILDHTNRPSLASYDENYEDADSADGSPFRPLYNDNVLYSGQPLALVVAESLEMARHAGSLIRIEYEQQAHQTDLQADLEQAHDVSSSLPKPRGNFEGELASSALSVDVTYNTPNEYHNPMEPHASTVLYQADGSLQIHDKTQGTQNCQDYLHKVFGLEKDKIRVLAAFVGGAFGSGLRPQYQLPLAVMAALHLKRSVRVTLTRQQMFTFGYRPRTVQRLRLGAAANGRLLAVGHEAIGQTSRFEDFTEHVVEWSGMLYQCDNVQLTYKLVPLDVYTPLDMRAPGAALGLIGLECAMDELACALAIDPVRLRLTNFAERNGNEDKPYSSKELRECYAQGAERFGWERRNPEPRSMRQGRQLVGWGMAGGVWEAMQMKASAKARLGSDGKLVVSSATTDIGTGTYTVMTQIAAETLGLAVEDVTFLLGDSSLPTAPLQGGSFTVSSVGTAVQQACQAMQRQLLEVAKGLYPQHASTTPDQVRFESGSLHLGDQTVSIAELAAAQASGVIEVQVDAEPDKKREAYAAATHSAVFVEVLVDEDLGTIKVNRVVSAIAAGRVVNPKMARSQILGGVVWGMGMALQEEAMVDHGLGRPMNHSLAEYHIPVNADIGDIDVLFVEEHDEIVNALGSKGVGEIGIVGVPAAIANAIYHATGKRIREFPITLDKLL